MKKGIAIGAACCFAVCLAAGYWLTVRTAEREREQTARAESRQTVQARQEIGADTEMVYRYFYTDDRITKEQREPAPAFLQGLDREQLQSIYHGWQMELFSPERVILRCKIEGSSSETYLLGQDNGYLAVFYEDGDRILHLKERTEVPLSALPEGEATQLREGIRVTGEENLARLLGDYMS